MSDYRVLAAAAMVLLGALGARSEAAPADKTARPVALELLVLGSGGPAALGRASSSYLLLLDGEPRILVDAGPGSFARVGEARVSLEHLDTVLLTHLHVDHAAELPGFVKARAVSASGPIHFNVYGPTGQAAHAEAAEFPSTSRFVDLLFRSGGVFPYLKDFSAPVTFNVKDLPATSVGAPQARTILTEDGLVIRSIAGHHGDAPAIIYRVDYRGHSIAFSGDIDAHGLLALESIARAADLLVFDAVVLDPPESPQILYTLHTPPNAIGALAERAHVRTLLLSHLSPAVEASHSEVTSAIARHYQGGITFATDGMRLQP
jgi:ribonuclease BN (tRNA processing enzyme)